ncbi:putative transposase [Marinobacter sp. LV10R520-4]|uniref:IS200/IS605 family transposase n=1 Tax=Marinobacter sp. LV10R520-4 TaxID=1761796 RepID=UPI000BF8E0A0|nr:IS200/IS605 family transposase [Marinobacter sp. LV10R520-4]PFG53427.1 putative transposase [Marinobacter sp. LV10R520-4]
MSENNHWRKGRSVVYKNTVHLVFVTKYRRSVFTDGILTAIEGILRETCEQMGSELLEFNGEGNHVHLIVSAHPRHSLSNFVGKLKGKSAYVLRRDFHEEIRPWLWGSHFWSPSYCVVSTGGASLDAVTKYIQEQARPL